jgi:hypothetical protein
MAPEANAGSAAETTRDGLWVANVFVATLLAFIVGYYASVRTGVEPGYFDAPEAGGYGVAPATGPKVSDDLRKYYEQLLK